MPNLTYQSHDDLVASWPTPLKIGLLTADPMPDGTDVFEPEQAYGYERQEFAFTKSRPVDAGYEGTTLLTNNDNIVFGPATNTWTPFNNFGLFDANGILRAYGRTRTERAVNTGNAEVFTAGKITFYLR